ncbi:hypothetical protein B0H14DRAFT_2586257 [Mycena olivaceomarginata]|nr:hypothetical protein B0H14DRAFT_2586257 [Mycena olivaceomarginata]
MEEAPETSGAASTGQAAMTSANGGDSPSTRNSLCGTSAASGALPAASSGAAAGTQADENDSRDNNGGSGGQAQGEGEGDGSGVDNKDSEDTVQAKIAKLWQRRDAEKWTEELTWAHRGFECGKGWGIEWAWLVSQFYDFEAAWGYTDVGGQITTSDRPTALQWWIGRGRKWDVTVNVGVLGDAKVPGTFVASWWNYMITKFKKAETKTSDGARGKKRKAVEGGNEGGGDEQGPLKRARLLNAGYVTHKSKGNGGRRQRGCSMKPRMDDLSMRCGLHAMARRIVREWPFFTKTEAPKLQSITNKGKAGSWLNKAEEANQQYTGTCKSNWCNHKNKQIGNEWGPVNQTERCVKGQGNGTKVIDGREESEYWVQPEQGGFGIVAAAGKQCNKDLLMGPAISGESHWISQYRLLVATIFGTGTVIQNAISTSK